MAIETMDTFSLKVLREHLEHSASRKEVEIDKWLRVARVLQVERANTLKRVKQINKELCNRAETEE